tara:strand:- start:54 stop:509 length:456 start_codon:yes stop_codon:yes gene_type:complete
MNKKQLLERQILKEFLNESFRDQGPATQYLQKTVKSAAGAFSPVNLDFVGVLANAFNAKKWSDIKKEMGDGDNQQAYEHTAQLLTFFNNLAKLMEPDTLMLFYKDDPHNFTLNILNKALAENEIQDLNHKIVVSNLSPKTMELSRSEYNEK